MLPPRSTVSLFSQNPTTRALVRTVCATRGWNYVEAASLVEVVEEGLVILDQKHIDQTTLNQLRNSPARRSMTIVVLARDLESPLVGADLVVDAACVNDFVQMLTRDISPRLVVNYDRLLAVSLITHERASTQVTEDIASAFGVAKCMLSMRGTSGDASMAHGDTIEAGMVAPARVRQCLAWRASLVSSERAFSSTTIAVPVELAQGQGYLALIADRVCLPAAEQMRLLETLSTRLAVEHGVRTAYERTSAELDRVSTGPGLDSLLPIWNRAALLELAAMLTSSSRRANAPFAICVLDIVELRLTNTRHGLEVGDRLLHRVADTMRTSLRQEDILGRWSGDELAILLPSTTAEGAQRVAQRVITRLAARQLSAGNTPIPIQATFGIAMIEDNEEPAAALSRAARAALDAQRSEGQILLDRPQTDGGPAPRISRQLDAAREDLGTIIGGSFRLLHEISRGGMGVVYRAEDLALERPVAIKMIRPDVAEDREVLERLRTEATMLARLQHPNLVQIYSFGQHGGDSYLVMELVEGESLDQAFDRHRLEGSTTAISDIIQMVEQVASALDLLHDRGIVHRDVKPANVIFDPFRVRSVLVDVGIATVRGQHQHVAGTPGFIAPEVLQGAVANGQSDVYALAATAYALLTLTLPWGTGNAVAIVTRQVSEKLQPPSAIRPELAPFDDVIASAMSLDPSERPATAGGFARALRAAAKKVSSTARAPTEVAAEAVPNTTSDAPSGAQRTRGVVFRSVNRALGLRDAAKLREQLRTDSPELAQALSDAAPLAWLPSARFTELLTRVPALLNREPRAIARDLARATVRASFRRFFPTSAATLVPERTLFAIRNVWARYQAWGQIQSMPVGPMEVVVRVAHGLYEPLACEWTCGLIEQLLVLSGAGMPVVVHEQCECNGADACVFRATWTALEGDEPSEHQGVE